MNENETTRTKKTLLNACVSISGYLIVAVLGFVVRLVFIRYLAIELLGINGVFTSIISIFSLAELGFAVAISYALYKPLAFKDEKKVAALMSFYKKVYVIIGCVIAAAGLCLLPFLQYVISEYKSIGISLDSLRLVYLIFLAMTVFPYFISYKRTLIVADQKKYIPDLVVMIFGLIKGAAQIAVIILLKDFVAYLLVALCIVILEQTVINVIVTKKYPYIKKYSKEKLLKADKKSLFANIGALSIARAGSALTTGIVSLIILSFVGLKEVGMYSNYVLITTSLTAVLSLLFSSATASTGNFVATESKLAQKRLFKQILYMSAFFGVLFFTGFLLLLNDFIAIWLGVEMILDNIVPIIISIDIFFWIMRNSSWIMYEANGLYKHFYYRTFFEIAVFIGVAIPGAIFFGVAGVVAAKVVAVLLTQIPVECFVVSKYGLGVKVKFYFALLAKYVTIAIVVACISFLAVHFVPISGILGFLVKGMLITFISVLIYLGVTIKSEEFAYFKNKILKNDKKRR